MDEAELAKFAQWGYRSIIVGHPREVFQGKITIKEYLEYLELGVLKVGNA
jgi:hypothetical protein